MTDQELRDLVASLAVKSDRLDALMAETTCKLDKAAALVGNIDQNQGAVAEEFFFNSLQAKPVLGGVQHVNVNGGQTPIKSPKSSY